MSDSTWSVGSTGLRSYEDYIKTREPTNELGKDDFLALLAAQMQYQNPLEPTSDTAFVAQLAQFSSLEQISNLSSVMTSSQNYNYVGQYVLAPNVKFDDGSVEDIFGLVSRIFTSDGESYAQIGDNVIKTSAITQVYDKDMVTGSNPILDMANLVGRDVTANALDADGNKITINGTVTRITVDSEKGVIATLRDYNGDIQIVQVSNIIDISDGTERNSGAGAGDEGATEEKNNEMEEAAL